MGYVVHGRVVSGPEVRLAPDVKKPYRYWTLEITDQPVGASLGSRVEIREKGGELGEIGYHMAGAASFAPGEEVFVSLRDTVEAPETKEVYGLMSGKYTLQADGAGKQTVMSGLGTAVSGPNGPLSPEEFTNALRRMARGEATAEDKDIWVTRGATHGNEDPQLEAHARQSLGMPARGPAEAPSTSSLNNPASTATQVRANHSTLQENSVQVQPPAADEASTGSSSWGWLIALVILAGVGFVFYLALRR